MVVMIVRDQHDIDLRQRVERDAGSFTRFGPMKSIGDTRSDQTGSIRMLSPAVWIRKLAWPTKEMRNARPLPARRRIAEGLGTQAGHPSAGCGSTKSAHVGGYSSAACRADR